MCLYLPARAIEQTNKQTNKNYKKKTKKKQNKTKQKPFLILLSLPIFSMAQVFHLEDTMTPGAAS